MKIRAQLILAFFLLAVVPLAGVTVYSYSTTLRAFRQAVEAEAGAMAEDMSGRMEAVMADLDRRIERLGDLPLSELAKGKTGAADEELVTQFQAEMGATADLVESLEFVPTPAVAPVVPTAGPGVTAAVPEVPDSEGEAGPPAHRWVFRHGPTASPAGVPPPPEAGVEVDKPLAEADKAQAEGDTARAEGEKRRKESLAAAQAALAVHREQMKILLGRDFSHKVRKGGGEVGTLRARVRPQQILRSVLVPVGHREGEISFAVDREGHVFAPDPADVRALERIPLALPSGDAPAETRQALGDWVVVTRKDPASGLTLGIARPVGESLREIRRTAARNLGCGLGMVGLALLGILPLSRRMTRNLAQLAEGAERLGRGDLEARVPVRSQDEFGRLAETFNRMAQELRAHQERLVEQERLRKELEMCRRIQEEMLPHEPLRFPFAEVTGVSIPAREVGGDFFNYFALPGGEAALLVGDVSGKGVPAALLMANLQATLRARVPLERGLVDLALSLDRELDSSTPLAAYLTLFTGILEATGVLRYVNAGHNAPLVLRTDGRVEALEATGRPLGLYPGGGYEERRILLDAGDTLFLYTDGLVEAEDGAGEPFGLARLQALLAGARTTGPEAILASVEEAVRAHRGGAEAMDDATLVALKVGAAPSRASA